MPIHVLYALVGNIYYDQEWKVYIRPRYAYKQFFDCSKAYFLGLLTRPQRKPIQNGRFKNLNKCEQLPQTLSLYIFEFLIFREHLVLCDVSLSNAELLNQSLIAYFWVLEILQHLAFFLQVHVILGQLFNAEQLDLLERLFDIHQF